MKIRIEVKKVIVNGRTYLHMWVVNSLKEEIYKLGTNERIIHKVFSMSREEFLEMYPHLDCSPHGYLLPDDVPGRILNLDVLADAEVYSMSAHPTWEITERDLKELKKELEEVLPKIVEAALGLKRERAGKGECGIVVEV